MDETVGEDAIELRACTYVNPTGRKKRQEEEKDLPFGTEKPYNWQKRVEGLVDI